MASWAARGGAPGVGVSVSQDPGAGELRRQPPSQWSVSVYAQGRGLSAQESQAPMEDGSRRAGNSGKGLHHCSLPLGPSGAAVQTQKGNGLYWWGGFLVLLPGTVALGGPGPVLCVLSALHRTKCGVQWVLYTNLEGMEQHPPSF